MSISPRNLMITVVLISAGAALWMSVSSNRQVRAENQILKAKLNASKAACDALVRRDLQREVEWVRIQKEANEWARLKHQKPFSPGASLPPATNRINGSTAIPRRNEALPAEGRYVATDEFEFAGWETPEDTLRSWKSAIHKGDYEQWLTSLGPEELEQELANANSLQDFATLQSGSRDEKGFLVMAEKSLTADRVELKVRFDREASAVILIVPLVAVGSDWKVSGEFHPYSQAWDSTPSP